MNHNSSIRTNHSHEQIINCLSSFKSKQAHNYTIKQSGHIRHNTAIF